VSKWYERSKKEGPTQTSKTNLGGNNGQGPAKDQKERGTFRRGEA